MLSRVIVGARAALIIPIFVVALAVLIGAPLEHGQAKAAAGWTRSSCASPIYFWHFHRCLAMAIAFALGRGLDKAAIALIIS